MSNVVICTQDDLDQGVVCLTRGQSIGLAMDSAAGFISLGALVAGFSWLFVSLHDVCDDVDSVNSFTPQRKSYYTRRSIQQPMVIFVASLRVLREHS
jgi:hypothetical protein